MSDCKRGTCKQRHPWFGLDGPVVIRWNTNYGLGPSRVLGKNVGRFMPTLLEVK